MMQSTTKIQLPVQGYKTIARQKHITSGYFYKKRRTVTPFFMMPASVNYAVGILETQLGVATNGHFPKHDAL